MNNKELLRQYVGTCNEIPASQLSKLSNNMRRTFFRNQIAMVEQLNNFEIYDELDDYWEYENQGDEEGMDYYLSLDEDYNYISENYIKLMPSDMIAQYVEVIHPKVLGYLLSENYSLAVRRIIYKGIMDVKGARGVMEYMDISQCNPKILYNLTPEQFEQVMTIYKGNPDFYRRKYAQYNNLPLNPRQQIEALAEGLRDHRHDHEKMAGLWESLSSDVFKQGIDYLAEKVYNLDTIPLKYYQPLMQAKKVSLYHTNIYFTISETYDMERLKDFLNIVIDNKPEDLKMFTISDKRKFNLAIELVIQRVRKGVEPKISAKSLTSGRFDTYSEFVEYFENKKKNEG